MKKSDWKQFFDYLNMQKLIHELYENSSHVILLENKLNI
jgi:predicted nuclease of restriction endonuclease-like RecB superfamily